MNSRGLTVMELLVSLSIFAFCLIMGISGFRALFSQLEISSGLRTVTSALNMARYQAVAHNRPVRVECGPGRLVLRYVNDASGRELQSFALDRQLQLKMNAIPIFYATGYAYPLCTIEVSNNRHCRRVTLSINGRVRVMSLH